MKIRARRKTGGRARRAWTIGVDTGGTFTDIVCRGPGILEVVKLPSTPDNPARAVIEGVCRLLERLAASGKKIPHLEIVHGSTVATNTILERKGARTALVTTAGFRDLIEIGRQNRPALYDLDVRRPEPLVPKALRLEVRERMLPDGEALVPLDRRALARLAAKLRGRADAVAVGFLFSYRNPAHERAAAELLRARLPEIPITLSSSVSPGMREYERFSTAILNAYVSPRMRDYLAELRRGLPEAAIEIMGSGGGTMPLERARREPVATVLSGPAAGVLGAQAIAARAGFPRIITFDMGGTSTDVSLVDGRLRFREESAIGGLPLRLPILDVHTVGAGGGSIARIDPGGGLRVGPESAGADPGPAVYGRGEEATVTDAHVHLGHLGADSFLGGEMRIFPERAAPPLERLARRAGMPTAELARGVLAVADAEMERAVRVVSQERGHDPGDFTLVAFGGASGLHAASMARDLRIPRVLVPRHPGLLCAWGMLGAERVRWRARTVLLAASRCPAAKIRRLAGALERKARADFPGIPRRALRRRVELDLRFQGQTHVLTLRFDDGPGTADYAEAFRRRHRERFGLIDAGWPIEVVAVRVCVGHPRRGPAAGRTRSAVRRGLRPKPAARRRMRLESGARAAAVPVHRREDLAAGNRIAGPAVIAEYSATTLLPADWRLEVDRDGNLILEPR